MIKLVPIDTVRASDYNPRRNDEKRLAVRRSASWDFCFPSMPTRVGKS